MTATPPKLSFSFRRGSARRKDPRSVDLQILTDWIVPGSKVLDLGCGRGILLESLQQRGVTGLGVDLDFEKAVSAIHRGLSVYQGDMVECMRAFPDGFFDHVICSRTVQELNAPHTVICEALRVGHRLSIGFVNQGYWKNRCHHLWFGHRVRNEVFPDYWETSRPGNPVSLSQFEEYCQRAGWEVEQRVCLRGDWRTPCRWAVGWRAGYVLFCLRRGAGHGLPSSVGTAS